MPSTQSNSAAWTSHRFDCDWCGKESWATFVDATAEADGLAAHRLICPQRPVTGDDCRQQHPAGTGRRAPLGNILVDTPPPDPATRAAKAAADHQAAVDDWLAGDDIGEPVRSKWAS